MRIRSSTAGDDALFQQLYKAYSAEFIQWAQWHYQVDEPTARDCFQEAMSNLYLNAYGGQLKPSNATLKTYIFAIGKNHILKNNQKYHRESGLKGLEDEDDETFIDQIYDPDQEKTIEAEKVSELLDDMEKPCRQLLQLVYLSSYTYEQIAEKLGCSQHVLRTKKWRCLKKIKWHLNQ